MAEIIGVRFKREGKQYYFDPMGLQVALDAGVIVETSWGMEFGHCVRSNADVAESSLAAPLRPVIRLATQEDLARVEKNREKEQEAFEICQHKILEHGLDMKLVDVEMAFEGNKILFFFTSEGRVDFRALVKDLAAAFHSRIELRQIGVRDEAKMIGGLGICGRPFCCASFLREFVPVSIKMAKTQNLSLNPTKISGTCGRLMCCLKYEQDAYEDLLRNSPRVDSFVETPDGVGDIINVNTLREKVRVRLDNAPDTLKVYHNSEIRIIRAGKGRRPEDYKPPSAEELAKLRRVQEEVLEEVRRPDSALYSGRMIPNLDEGAAPPANPLQPRERGRSNKPRREQGKPSSGARREDKPPKAQRPNRPGAQAVLDRANTPPHEKPAHEKQPFVPKEGGSTAEKKNRRPYWRKKPGNHKPKRKEGGE